METTEEFGIKLTEIADLAFYYGIESLPDAQKSRPGHEWSKDEMDFFMEKCHDGFKLAQNRLVEEVMSYQLLYRQNKEHIKQSRSGVDKTKTKELQNKEKVIIRRLHNLSHIADGMVVQMLGQQVDVARRLNIGEKGSKHLENSNIEHVIKVVNELNKKPGTFALISDLTSYIQIGDIFVIDREKGYYISELKEGEVNAKLRKFIDTSLENGPPVCEGFQPDFTDHEMDQIKRMLKQDLRALQAVEIVNTDEGIDPKTGGRMTVRTPVVDMEFYDGIFIPMLEELKTKNWSYTVLDRCLHIGMYHGEVGLLMAAGTIPGILERAAENYIVVDLMAITESLSETLFAKPLPKDFVIKLMTGQAKIIIGIDMDKLIQVFNDNGVKTRWLSKRETGKVNSNGKKLEIVVINGRAIGIELGPGKEGIVSGGIISKIVFDNVLPSSLAQAMSTAQGPTMKFGDEHDGNQKI